jgi:hypothetical protein
LEALTKWGQAPRRLGACPHFVRACYGEDAYVERTASELSLEHTMRPEGRPPERSESGLEWCELPGRLVVGVELDRSPGIEEHPLAQGGGLIERSVRLAIESGETGNHRRVRLP